MLKINNITLDFSMCCCSHQSSYSNKNTVSIFTMPVSLCLLIVFSIAMWKICVDDASATTYKMTMLKKRQKKGKKQSWHFLSATLQTNR